MEHDNKDTFLSDKKLPILKPLIGFIIFASIIAILFTFLSQLSQKRKHDVYVTYATETQNYINANRGGLKTLFSEVFVPCSSTYYSICTSPQASKIPQLVSSNLKDWSSTMFIKQINNQIYYMRLSGDINILNTYPEDKKVAIEKLLKGEVSEIPWDEYSYELHNKEVVIPVKDDSGQIMGAIMRSVIESKSF